MFNARAFAVARLAESLYADYLGYDALLKLGRDPRARAHAPEREPGQNVPVGRILRPDGSEAIVYHYLHFLTAATQPGVELEHARAWLGGALITLGDALKRNGYFDHDPSLEMVKHLRNAVAHGNRFDIRDSEGLDQYPAYTVWTPESGGRLRREITADLHGKPFMFEFMEHYEIPSLIQRVGSHLSPLAGDLPDGKDAQSLMIYGGRAMGF